jgi:hypothetical protein
MWSTTSPSIKESSMTSRNALVAGLVATALLAGCGSSDTGPANAGAWCQAYTNTVTAKWNGCGPSLFPEPVLGSVISMIYDCQTVQAAQDAGRIAYDRSRGQACLDAIQGLTCAQFNNSSAILLGACGDAMVGKVPPGGTCYSGLGYECAGGSCDLATFSACRTGGTCVTYAKWGESCLDPVACGPGLVCNLSGVCETEPTTTFLNAGGDCTRANTVCNDGLYCHGTTGLCTATMLANAACTGSEECRTGLHCDTATLVCTAKLKLGDSCVPGERKCGGNAYCGAGNTCVASPVVGADCTPVPGEVVFCQNSWCAPPVAPATAPRCAAFAAPGAACDTGNTLQCGFGYECAAASGSAGVCTRNYCGF